MTTDQRPKRKVSTSVVLLLFAVLLSLLFGAAIRFADKLRLDAFLSANNKIGDQSQNDEELFYESRGDSSSMQDAEPTYQQSKQVDLSASYTIELGLTKNADEADSRVKDLARLGINAYYTPLHREGRPLFRIRVGVFQSVELAQMEANQIKQRDGSLAPKISRL